jgi:hypothetical protein
MLPTDYSLISPSRQLEIWDLGLDPRFIMLGLEVRQPSLFSFYAEKELKKYPQTKRKACNSKGEMAQGYEVIKYLREAR